MEPDFDMFIRRNPQHYPYRHRVSPSLDSPLFSAKETAGKGTEHVTSQYMLLLFTICFVAAYHFRASIFEHCSNLRTWQGNFIDYLLDVVAMIKFYIDSAWNLILNLLFSLAENDKDYITSTTRIRSDTNVKTTNNSNVSLRLGRSMNMPQLEFSEDEVEDCKKQPVESHGSIEPAFLHSSHYPTGWLIFDPKLGLVRVSGHPMDIDSNNTLSESISA